MISLSSTSYFDHTALHLRYTFWPRLSVLNKSPYLAQSHSRVAQPFFPSPIDLGT